MATLAEGRCCLLEVRVYSPAVLNEIAFWLLPWPWEERGGAEAGGFGGPLCANLVVGVGRRSLSPWGRAEPGVGVDAVARLSRCLSLARLGPKSA